MAIYITHFAQLFGQNIVHAQSYNSLKDIHFKSLRQGDLFQ